MDEGLGLIPDALVSGAGTNDTEAAAEIAQRLLPAVRELTGRRVPSAGLSVHHTTSSTDVSCYRIDIEDSPYYATITEHNVIERYSIERPRSAGRRVEMRPVLVEIMHIFTVHDAEGALVSATEALRASGKPATILEPNVFSELFEAARSATAAQALPAAVTAAR